MRAFLAVLVVAGLGGLFYYQKHPSAEVTSTNSAPAKASAQVAEATPAPRQPSEHNWMKRSLDRATEVRGQARTGTGQAQDP